MKPATRLTAALLAAAFAAAPFTAFAADAKADKAAVESKPEKSKYILKTCVVSDEALGSMGDPHVFTHEKKEVQLCCKSCKKEFDKNPKKYLKKLTDAEKKAASKK